MIMASNIAGANVCKFIRLFLLIACFALCGFDIYQLAQHYMSHPIVANTQYTDKVSGNPGIVICPLLPVSMTKLSAAAKNQSLTVTVKKYSEIEKFARALWSENIEREGFLPQASIAASLRQLHQQLPLKFLKDANEVILHCRLNNEQCNATKFSLWRHPLFQVCYRLDLLDGDRFRELELTLATNDMWKHNCSALGYDKMCARSSVSGFERAFEARSGAVVLLYGQQQEHNDKMVPQKIIVPTGSRAKLVVESWHYKMLSLNNDNCQSEHEKYGSVSREACEQIEMQSVIETNCNCTSPLLISRDATTKKTFCTDMSNDWENFQAYKEKYKNPDVIQYVSGDPMRTFNLNKRLECYNNQVTKFKMIKNDKNLCKPLCDRREKKIYQNTESWPEPLSKEVIKDDMALLQIYKQLLHMLSVTSSPSDDVYNELSTRTATINIVQSLPSMIVEESILISLAALFKQVGITVCIWVALFVLLACFPNLLCLLRQLVCCCGTKYTDSKKAGLNGGNVSV